MEYYIFAVLFILNIIFVVLFVKYKEKYDNHVSFYLEREFNEVLNTMNQAILLFDKKGKLLFYNKYCEDILLLKTKDLGLTATNIFKDKRFDEQFDELTCLNFDFNYLKKIFSASICKIETESLNNSVDKIIILNNVTDERKIDETKKDFFSHASHELKSPLTAILGYSELVSLEMVDQSEYVEIIERIHNQAQHMALLVEDMSILARLESITEREEQYETVNLNRVLKEVIYTQEPFLNEKNIYINIMADDISFKCIELDINKLFKNLIENAIKYSPEESSINLKLYKEKNNIIFEIKDEGIGIAPEHLDRVFERFYRIDKGRIKPGTGLGLAIAKHTVIKYNGKVDIYSKLNEGTTIKVTLKA